MEKEKIVEKLNKQVKDGKIACKQALKIADEEGVSAKVLGEMLNGMKIKVVSCQLGCFP